MWFRNLLLYSLTEPFNYDPETLHEALRDGAFRPCSGLESFTQGWVPPAGREATQRVHATDGRMMLCLRREDRLLPAAVIREQVEEKAELIAEKESRSVGRKERRQLRDEVMVDLLPRAFRRSVHLFAYIDPQAGWIVIDSASSNRAEDLLSHLRDTLGSLKVRPLAVDQAPGQVLTGWLDNTPPADFALGDECELREPVENGTIMRARRIDLTGSEVRSHLDGGLQVARLATEWQDRIGCLLCDDLAIRRLRFLDLVLDEAADLVAEDPIARFDADFALMGREIAGFLPRVIEIYGGPAST